MFGICLSYEACNAVIATIPAFLDEADRKYLFECDSQEQCLDWIDSIIKARFDHFSSLLILSDIQEVPFALKPF